MTTLLNLLQVSNEALLPANEVILKVSLRLLIRLAIDLVSVFILVRWVYYEVYKKSELFFTFFIFNLVIFLICFLLNKVDMSLGAAFGLFAVFSMLRYRTEDISIKDMTYLFLVIAMGLINSVTKLKGISDNNEYIFLCVINALVIALAYLLESRILFKKEMVQVITYDNLDLILPHNQTLLIEDIKKRTGINVKRAAVSRIDFVRNTAIVKIYYDED